jgi:hypothetical protein
VDAEVTFLKHSSNRICISHIIGTGGPAIITADAAVRVDHDDPILPFIGGLHGTYGIAYGTFTLIT